MGKLRIKPLRVRAYRVPTDGREADGTLSWSSTTLVTVELQCEDKIGFGYTYAHRAAAVVIEETLLPLLRNRDPMEIPALWSLMNHEVRNFGRPGLISASIAAVDACLWDLKAKLLGLPLVTLLGSVRESIPVYGSGGFTSYSLIELQEQMENWTASGIEMVKMKIGTHPDEDLMRVTNVREVLVESSKLFVDANGAYTRKQALDFAERFHDLAVTWFEEPVSSDDLEGLRLLRDRAPGGMDIAAGEYGFDRIYFERMLAAGAVDTLQADATRCGGITGFLQAADLASAHGIALSAHTAPSIHLAVCCAHSAVCHLEYFYDHVRIENELFEGVAQVRDGRLFPDLERPGLGIEFKHQDAERFAL